MYNVIKGIMTVENLWRESSQGCGLVSQPTENAMRLYAVFMQNLQQKLTFSIDVRSFDSEEMLWELCFTSSA